MERERGSIANVWWEAVPSGRGHQEEEGESLLREQETLGQ